jgi:hypothetical protein
LSANDNPAADLTRVDMDFKVANTGHTVGRIASFYTNSGGGGYGGLRFYTRNAGSLGEVMRLTPSGNVGIGTTNPSNRLHIAGGDARIGEINPLNTGTFPGYGRYLYFSGGPAGSSWDSENSDPLWIARYNVASDQTELRVNIGDDCQSTDAFVVGTFGGSCSPSGPRWNIFRVQANGNVGIGTTTPQYPLHITSGTQDGTSSVGWGPGSVSILALILM